MNVTDDALITERLPKLGGRGMQKYQHDIEGNLFFNLLSSREYCFRILSRRGLFAPLLDTFLEQIDVRFTSHRKTVFRMQALIPAFIHRAEFVDLEESFHF